MNYFQEHVTLQCQKVFNNQFTNGTSDKYKEVEFEKTEMSFSYTQLGWKD